MHDLVKAAIAAHGGLEEWTSVREVSAALDVSGLGFKQRGPIGDAVAALPMRVTVNTRDQQARFEPFAAVGQIGSYQPHRTVIHSAAGVEIEALGNPRDVLKTIPLGTPWTAPQVLYFLGYSMWMYFTLPYSFLENGVVCEEIDPWHEGAETWRALKVSYPSSYPSHSTEQVHYFDETGLMRRQDYTVDVRQNLGAAHYLDDHQVFDGFVFPTRRRIYARGADGVAAKDRLLISADLNDFEISRATR
ncbi:hypothetical protein [Roseixanthobacter glucoisosaccharinicivorans]|uniref:hypothetical protein n=1 Tax=Roseixanthobacter glucoisosaccharinicivorans TaxID=3119923 RepID=UPI0037274BED